MSVHIFKVQGSCPLRGHQSAVDATKIPQKEAPAAYFRQHYNDVGVGVWLLQGVDKIILGHSFSILTTPHLSTIKS